MRQWVNGTCSPVWGFDGQDQPSGGHPHTSTLATMGFSVVLVTHKGTQHSAGQEEKIKSAPPSVVFSAQRRGDSMVVWENGPDTLNEESHSSSVLQSAI